MEDDNKLEDILQLSKKGFILYFDDNSLVLTENNTFILRYTLGKLYIYNFKKSKSIAHIVNTILKKNNNLYHDIECYQQIYAKTKEEKRSLYKFIVNNRNKDFYLYKIEYLIRTHNPNYSFIDYFQKINK